MDILTPYWWTLKLYFCLQATVFNCANGQESCQVGEISRVLCQEQLLIINCPNGTVIEFKAGNFGRTGHCAQYLGIEIKDCDSREKTLDILKRKCGYMHKSSCQLSVTKKVFGNPCKGVTNYLEVLYSCVPLNCIEMTTTSFDPRNTSQTLSLALNMTTATKMTTAFSVDDHVIGIISGATAALVICSLMILIVIMIRNKRKKNKIKKKTRSDAYLDPVGSDGLQDDQSEMMLQRRDSDNINSERKSIEQKARISVSNSIDQDSFVTITENVKDGHGKCCRKISVVHGKHSSDDEEENSYDTSFNICRMEESNYDFNVPDDTYDVSTRCDRQNIVKNHVDDTYNHFTPGLDQNELNLN